MDEKEQISRFAGELNDLVARYRAEYDLTYASVIGVLQMQTMHLWREAAEPE